MTYEELRRAAIGVSSSGSRTAASSPGEVVILLGRHSIEAAVAMLGCLHRGVVLAPLPPMFNDDAAVGAARADAGRGDRDFGGEKEIAKCREVAGEVPLAAGGPAGGRGRARGERLPADREPRDADDLAMVLHSSGHDVGAQGHRALQQHAALRDRGRVPRWGLTGEDIYLTSSSSASSAGWSSATCRSLLNGATGVLLNRWDAEEALRLIEEHRCTYVLAMPTHAADMIRAAEQTDARPLVDARARRPGADAGAAHGHAGGVRRQPLGDYGLSEVPGHAAHAPDDPDEKILRTEGRPYDGTEIRIVDDDEQPLPAGKVGSVIVNGPSRFLGFFNNDDADARVADRLGRLPHRRPRLCSTRTASSSTSGAARTSSAAAG